MAFFKECFQTMGGMYCLRHPYQPRNHMSAVGDDNLAYGFILTGTVLELEIHDSILKTTKKEK